jgi:hypothetical protein
MLGDFHELPDFFFNDVLFEVVVEFLEYSLHEIKLVFFLIWIKINEEFL